MINVHSHSLKLAKWMRFLSTCNNGKLKLLPLSINYSQSHAIEMVADAIFLLIVY